MRSCCSLMVISAAFVASCFNPESPAESDATSGGETSDDQDESGQPTNPNDPAGPGSASESADASSGNDSPDCGNGEIESGEACDDGINDGAYGGCLPDCSEPAPYCGNGQVDGPEACDDGTNDGAYGGCAPGCSALAGYCGDGIVDGPEQCDEGDSNRNASGCNVDCVVSGSPLGAHDIPGLSFCDGAFVTAPLHLPDGPTVVAATGYCSTDSVVLIGLDRSLNVVTSYDNVLLPTTPILHSTFHQGSWILSASGCNYRLSPEAQLTEICDERIEGYYGLDSAGDSYVALDYNEVGYFGGDSPRLGDTPIWSRTPQDNSNFTYGFNTAVMGPSGSVVIGARRQTSDGNNRIGYIYQFTSAGNEARAIQVPDVEGIYRIAMGPQGRFVGVSAYPDYTVLGFNSSFDNTWSFRPNASGTMIADVDSAGDIVVAYQDADDGRLLMVKLAPDGSSIRWDVELAGHSPNDVQLSTDRDDVIWVASAPYYKDAGFLLTITRHAP